MRKNIFDQIIKLLIEIMAIPIKVNEQELVQFFFIDPMLIAEFDGKTIDS